MLALYDCEDVKDALLVGVNLVDEVQAPDGFGLAYVAQEKGPLVVIYWTDEIVGGWAVFPLVVINRDACMVAECDTPEDFSNIVATWGAPDFMVFEDNENEKMEVTL